MKTLGVVMIGCGLVAIVLGLVGVGATATGVRSLPFIGVILVAGGWVLYRHNKKKELAERR